LKNIKENSLNNCGFSDVRNFFSGPSFVYSFWAPEKIGYAIAGAYLASYLMGTESLYSWSKQLRRGTDQPPVCGDEINNAPRQTHHGR
jgi:hypothetical protein